MHLGDLQTLRERLGGKKPDGRLVISETYACALKKAAGMTGSRYFDVDAVIAFRRNNPGWKMTSVYPRKKPTQQRPCIRKGRRSSTVGKSGGRS